MKKIYLFFVLLILIGCGDIPFSQKNSVPIACPDILFVSEHKTYVGSLSEIISLDNIAYQAEINNAIFTNNCQMKENIFFSNLTLLFIVSPLEEMQSIINLPFYVAVIDENKDVRDIQYYSITDTFKNNPETGELVETELTKTILVSLPSMDESLSVLVGFMLDEQHFEILN